MIPEEWKKYKFSKEQQVDVAKRKGLVTIPPPAPPLPAATSSAPEIKSSEINLIQKGKMEVTLEVRKRKVVDLKMYPF